MEAIEDRVQLVLRDADALIDHIGEMTDITRRSGDVPMMTELDRRFEVMDMFGPDYQQVLSLASPPLEHVAEAPQALELSRIGTDSMADLCAKYPERFPAFIATAALPRLGGEAAGLQQGLQPAGRGLQKR